MARPGYLASVKGQSSAVAMTAEATTGTGNISYQITNSAKRILDLNTDVVVNVGGSPVTTGFTISYLTGTVTFETAATRTVTITGAYVVLTTIADAKAYKFTGTREVYDYTVFKAAFKAFEAGMKSGTATLSRFYVADSYFFTWLTDNSIKVIEFYVDDSLAPIRFYAVIMSSDVNAPVGALIEQSIEFQITKEVGGLYI
jgi:hypothetical protein